ncbi:AmmeMemoRadiSam system protein B [Desulfoluna butyratoxydans]|uniref:Ammememosam b: ammememoradisam system protein b n=1 Tax=Desulfoluna butyratoxydans TaxID=231438 RepID=A0A4U8YJL0_9BACT|nr:AmmeMemoRadiSam system protein B [Desulfoluna butyratoxydans]VFQ43956.1 ammememosam b: ammememoradisam system protein b [Desulfoluna butyratoxydans]
MGARKRAALRGQWYPESREACFKEVEGYRKEGWLKRPSGDAFQAGIVPHAGWFFSGSIACRVIETVARGELPDLVVLFGHHLGPSEPTSVMAEGTLETPFGDLRVHETFSETLGSTPYIRREMSPFMAPENTLELQLPFIRYFFGETPVCLMGVAPNKCAEPVGKSVVDAACTLGLTVKVIGSTDLTHYGPNFGFTPQGKGEKARAWVCDTNDREAIDHMTQLDAAYFTDEALARRNACCAGAVAATLAAARSLGIPRGLEIAHTTSFDKSPSDSFVGYTGVVF